MKKTQYFKQFTDEKTFSKLVRIKTMPLFMEHIKKYGDKIGVVDEQEITYNQIYDDALALAFKLKENDINEKENVGVFAPNNYDFVKATLGTMAYGAVATLFPQQLNDTALYYSMLKYNIKALFYAKELENVVELTKEKLPNIKFIKIEKFEKKLTSFSSSIKTDDPACIVLTSGTTGKHKGAILSHKALLTGVWNGALGLKEPFDQVYVSLIPFTHVFGLIRNLLTGLYTGSKVYTTPDMKQLFKTIKIANPTILVLVPALAEIFLKLSKEVGMGILGNNLKVVIAGGAHVSPYLTLEFNKLGIHFCPGYGLTESANLVSGNPEPTYKPRSIGKFYPNQQYKIVDNELRIKGDNLMIKYYNDEEENKKAFDEEGYFRTGDLVHIDEEGFLYITGRIKEIIVLPNGENVSPAYIENKINELEEVQDSLVYDETNENGVTILVAELLPRQRALAGKNIENLQQFFEQKIDKVNKSLDSYEKINKVVIRTEDFARTPSLKIIRPERKKK